MEIVKIKDIFPQLIQNKGGTITLQFNAKNSDWCSIGKKKPQLVRTLKVRCLKPITGRQQVHLLVTPIDRIRSEQLSIGSGTKVVNYK